MSVILRIFRDCDTAWGSLYGDYTRGTLASNSSIFSEFFLCCKVCLKTILKAKVKLSRLGFN